MKIEDPVVSLELAKELKERGIKQDSVGFWSRCDDVSSTGYGQGNLKLMLAGYDPLPDRIEDYAAPTVAELGEMLPGRIKSIDDCWYYLHIAKLENTNEWLIAYHNDEIKGNTEADARGKMITYLIKAGYLKAEDIGK